ncbi:MAG: hypothetical protein DMF25_07880 [Verrucomicrobia bacterium]|nr:MAG: hypothetical protein DMF25_07880 [Verrucomicrobiota bacterium]
MATNLSYWIFAGVALKDDKLRYKNHEPRSDFMYSVEADKSKRLFIRSSGVEGSAEFQITLPQIGKKVGQKKPAALAETIVCRGPSAILGND